MKIYLIVLVSVLLSACSMNASDENLMYSLHTIEYGHTNETIDNIELTIEEEDEIFKKDEIEALDLNFSVMNQPGETIEIGNHLDIERFNDGL